MARNKTLFLYNGTKPHHDQEWHVYSEHVVNETFTVGASRKSFTINLSGNVTIQFGVDNAVYLKATYTYSSDSWTHHTDTPNAIEFSASGSGVNVTSSHQ